MSISDFASCVQVLSSPYTDGASRHEADQWLTAFKRSTEAWAVAQQALQGPPQAETTLAAAQILAFKVKKQLPQLDLPQQSALLEVLAALLANPEQQPTSPLRRALCVALANLAIQCTDWARPLETLGPRLPQATMVEFLTVLPQECEDAAVAVQSGTAEQAFHLKQRVREWCLDVMGWLHSVHSSAMQALLARQQQPVSLEEAVVRPGGAEATLPLVQCFSAWVKWGCLQYVQPDHAAYFTRVAGALLRGPLSLQATGVDAVSEVVEHATEALTPLLIEMVLHLPPLVEQGVLSGEGGELSHVLGLFCGTHQRVCVGDSQEGQALRQGLLRLLALPRPQGGPDDEAGCEVWTEAVLPAVDAAYEVCEYMLRLGKGVEEEEEEDDLALPYRPIPAPARLEFCSAVVHTLLLQLQPFDSAFTLPAQDSGTAGWGGGSHPPAGVPQTARDEAEVLVDVLAEALGGDALMQQLQAVMEGTLAQHGVHSMQAAKVLDVCFYCLRCGAGVYGAHHHRPGQQPPPWLRYMLRLYGLAAEVAPATAQGGAPAPAATLLDYDLLSSITALAPALVPLLGGADGGAVYWGFMDLVLSRALNAVVAPVRTTDVSYGSTTDVSDAAADAVRAICSFSTSAGFQTREGVVAVIEQLLSLLQQPARLHIYQGASQQVVVALVHAAEGIPADSTPLLQRAAAALQAYVFAPLTAALQQLPQGPAAAPAPSGSLSPGRSKAAAVAAVGSAAWRLQWALKQVQALLNALELYQVYGDDGAGFGGARQGSEAMAASSSEQAAAGPAGLTSGAVEAFLSCWQWLVAACATPLPGEVYSELSLCLSSCISLAPRTFEPALGSLADLAAACFFMPGGAQLSQALCRAVETYGCQPRYQQPLLGMLSSLLSAAPAQAMLGLRGGDAQPEPAQALLSLVGCTLRQAASWRQHSGPGSAPAPAATIAPLLSNALRLAVANTACNCRDVSQRAVAVLSSLAVLALELGSPLGGEARLFLRTHGSGVVQGMLLALMSLNSASHLPKVVSLMGDVAMLAAACAISPGAGALSSDDVPAVHAAASQLLSSWLAEAQAGLAASGVLTQEAAAVLLGQLEWQGVLRQAAVQVVQRQQEQQEGKGGGGGSPGGLEVRRAMQRSLRHMADAIRQAGLCI